MKKTINPRGVALVVVLAFLVLLSALIVSFFSSVTTEYTAAKSFSDGLSTRQLADSAVNLVMGQIREATTQADSAWASQPGMIRVYEQDGSVGGFYKLYSSDKMLLDQAAIRADGFRPDADVEAEWWKNPGLWTDLNAPIKIPNPNVNSSEKWIYRYPILDPGFSESFLTRKGKNLGNLIEGFDIDEDEAVASGAIAADQLTGMPPDETLARMPVKWIYMLKDGTLTAPLGGSKPGEVRWTAPIDSVLRPSKDNPVVGRIAFWTDDETAKVNINTSSGVSDRDVVEFNKQNGTTIDITDYPGSYWDTPRFMTYFERGNMFPNEDLANAGNYVKNPAGGPGNALALSQPINGEFQRCPGHPATNSMGVIFKEFLTSEQIYKLTPRIFGDKEADPANPSGLLRSSLGGINPDRLLAPQAGGDRELVASPMARKSERLYASVDEFLMSQQWDEKTGRKLNDDLVSASNVVTPELLEKTRFFLTANSRAPDLNLYGRPRVSLWPQNKIVANRTPSDNLLAFCSTIGTSGANGTQSSIKPFYFQRSNPWSGDFDFDSNDVLTQSPRNRFLLDSYLRKMTESPVPGFGDPKNSRFGSGSQTFAGKYGQVDHAQILVEMMDYIRTINIRDSTQDLDLKAAGKEVEKNRFKFAPYGLVVPTQVQLEGISTENVGIGRFPQISEIALVMYHAGYKGSYRTRDASGKPKDDVVATTPGQVIFGFDAALGRIPVAGDFEDPQMWYLGNKPLRYDDSSPDKKLKPVPVVRDANGNLCPVTPTHDLVRAFVILEWYNPMQGYAPTKSFFYTNDITKMNAFEVKITGLDTFALEGKNLNFPKEATETMWCGSEQFWHGRNSGGPEGFAHIFRRPVVAGGFTDMKSGKTPSSPDWYQFQTDAPIEVMINDEVGSVPQKFTGANLTITVSLKPASKGTAEPINFPAIPNSTSKGGISGSGALVKTISVRFPDIKDPIMPVPTDDVWLESLPTFTMNRPNLIPMAGGMWKTRPESLAGVRYDKFAANALDIFKLGINNGHRYASDPIRNGVDPNDVKSLAGRVKWAYGFPDLGITRDWNYVDNLSVTVPDRRLQYTQMWRQIVQPGDTVRSMVVGGGSTTSSTYNGANTDLRLLSTSPKLYSDETATGSSTAVFYAHPRYYKKDRQAQSLRTAGGPVYFEGYAAAPFCPHVIQAAIDGKAVSPLWPAAKIWTPNQPVDLGATFRLRELRTQFGNLATGLEASEKRKGGYRPELRKFKSLEEVDTPYIGVASSADLGRINGPYASSISADLPHWENMKSGVRNAQGQPGDFDNGLGSLADGAFANKTDEGNQAYRRWNSLLSRFDYVYTYYDWQYADPFESFFSPNRQVASAAAMGSLPAGRSAGWRTLCFSPNSAASVTNNSGGQPHPGELNPPDHLLLDLFNMPIVEPYAISEPFSTGGRINLNYQIAPFGWIKRSTPLRAALQSVRITAVPAADVGTYKTTIVKGKNYRLLVDKDEIINGRKVESQTIKSFDRKFDEYSSSTPEKGFFKSASQICEQFLYPLQASVDRLLISGLEAPKASDNPNASRESKEASIREFWQLYGQLTGDNVREKPYSDLYPRLTTKSNTFTVHMRVQTLKKRPFTGVGDQQKFYQEWVEGKDQVISEYRGSALIERYINPQDRRFDKNDPETVARRDYIDADQSNLEAAYKFRVLGVKRFLP